MVDKISTNPLQNIDSLLAEGVASSKYNLKKSKGLGCFPTSRFAQQVQGIYLCTACRFAKPVQVCIACEVSDFIALALLIINSNTDEARMILTEHGQKPYIFDSKISWAFQ